MKRRELIALFGGAGVSATSIVCPLSAPAQLVGKTYRLLILTSAKPYDPGASKRPQHWSAFFRELRRLGYEESRNLAVVLQMSEGDVGRAAEFAERVLELKPDVIFSPDVGMATILQIATAAIPVVSIAADPANLGLAISLARPGGNITGFSVDTGLEIYAKRIELLKQAIPGASRTGYSFRVRGASFLRSA